MKHKLQGVKEESQKLCFELSSDISKIQNHLTQVADEYGRVADLSEKAESVVEQIDNDFKKKTGLDGTDITFLFIATGMQILRQYLVTKFPEREDDQTAAKKVKGDHKEKSNRIHRYYNPSLDEIINNPVPFDANYGSGGALGGAGKLGHRATAIGHDPVLGLIFGTANIATSTLTTNQFASYHIYTHESFHRDYFKNLARTDLVLSKTVDKLLNGGLEGKKIVGASFIKEVQHLRSDLNTEHSLPIPFISAIDPQMASKLASYGLDMCNIVTVGKQATYAILINTLIAMIHALFYDESCDGSLSLYEVRTRKILSYSNVLASGSNIIVTAITEDMSKLDIGGLLVTIYRLISDYKFINEVKKDFLKNELHKKIVGSEYDFMKEESYE